MAQDARRRGTVTDVHGHEHVIVLVDVAVHVRHETSSAG
jgi:hypothetical protein